MKKIQKPRIQTPQLLNNLYRDLRDRRLLLPAAVLLVALVVVPMALSSSSATTPAPAPDATVGGSQQETATSPAVLAEQLGVTDYQRRLEQHQSKNPFERQYIDVPKDAGSDTSSSGTTASDSTTASTIGSSSTATPSTDASTISETPSTSTSEPPSSTGSPESPRVTLFVFEADLAIGPPGELRRRKHVGLGTFLPGDSKPMLAFAGAAEDMKHALFMVSDDISSVTGDGRCVPGNANCRLLQLKVGDEAKLAYAPESDRTYKLKLFGIDLAPADANAGKRGKRDSLFALAAQGR